MIAALAMAMAYEAERAPARAPQKISLNCDLGPLERQFGGGHWTIYACDDGATLVIAASDNNPAKPFYYVLAFRDGHYTVQGEGSRNKAASDAAGDEIRALSDTAIREMLKAAQAIGRHP